MFKATKAEVYNRGSAPDSFLGELVEWGKSAPEEIFAVNATEIEIYTLIKAFLGPWKNPLDRRAAMMEAMRVHAGFESSWNWDEGVDITNIRSQENITGEETGIFQVSFDSTYLSAGIKAFAEDRGIDTPIRFIPTMKSDHQLAMEYYARLVRINIQWAGPLKTGAICPWLSRDAKEEFQSLL